jgi:hypothetical protein
MKAGSDRVDVPYIWPRTLLPPVRPPKLVYLDLNHWIELSKALVGHRDGDSHRELLATCVDAVAQGRALFPISDSIYSEISKIRQHRQRRDLRQVIELVSQYVVVTSRAVVSSHEVEALLDQVVGPSPQPINTMHYLDWGVAGAFGVVGGFRVKSSDGMDVTADLRFRYPAGPVAFDQVLAGTELELNRKVIEGPTPEEDAELRALGWNPSAAFEVAELRAAQEVDQALLFTADPRWRRGRVRDVVAAREVLIQINDALYRGFSERGTVLGDAFPDVEHTRMAFDSMPSFDVSVTLKTSLHRDLMHQWLTNDIHDIDALGSTLPYCDVVVTDRAMASHARQSGLARRLDRVVLSRLSDLLQYL